MNSIKVNIFVKPALLALCAVAFSLSAFHSTTAKTTTKPVSNIATTVGDAGRTAVNAGEARRMLLRIINRKAKANPKLAKSLASACGCAAVSQDTEAFGSCFKRCLGNAGVSPAQLAACGAVCAVNLVGCAICVGVSEWVALACVQRCVWGLSFAPDDGPISRSQTRGLRHAKLLVKRAPAAT